MDTKVYDAIVVGTGAAGSIIAKELVAKNNNILIIEQGNVHPHIGKFKYAVQYYNLSKLLRFPQKTIEGTIVYQGILFGGTTVISCGNAVVSLQDELFNLGIDISDDLNELKKEISINKTRKELFSEATKQIIKASSYLGLTMQNMPKFLDNDKCSKCGNCVFGCKYGAKWSGNKLLSSKKINILFNSKVIKVISENGIAKGIEYITSGTRNVVWSDKVILSAGAISTPQILMNSGLNAGSNLSLDLFVNVYGYSDKFNQLDEPVMPVVSLDNFSGKGFIISPFINRDPIVRFIEGGIRTARIPRKGLVGLMVKTKDDSNGTVYQNGSFSKPITENDKKRLNEGSELSKEILKNIGVKSKDIVVSKIQGAHPIGTAAIGKVVDNLFQTQIKNLYACDASVLPESPGLPPILTILALAKNLSKHLN
jgi:choline dehydrogenase-like flavoprotein